MNREEIMKLIPHRDNMLLIDKVENIDGEAVGHYTVRGDEFFLKGHFPDNPIVPGVILCEILAQSACALMEDALKNGQLPVYTGLKEVKFRNPVKPGDTVETRCKVAKSRHPFYFLDGTVKVDDKLCVKASFSVCLTEMK